MTVDEYRNAVFCVAQISKELTAMLDEQGLDLFEQYSNTYEGIIRYEMTNAERL